MHTKQVDTHVDFRNIDQPTRPKIESLKSLSVGTQGLVAVDAGSEVTIVGRWQGVLGDGLEVEDIKRVFWRRNESVQEIDDVVL